MGPKLSAHADVARPSPTLAITAKAAAMRAQQVDVISFAAGEPDFPTPVEIREAAKAALDAGFTKYTPSSGIPDLKQAVCEKFARENAMPDVAPSQVVVSCGAKHSVFNALWVTAGPGDEVILIAPYWMTYLDQIRLCGAEAKVVHARPEDGYIPSLEAIRDAITPRTRAILVNSPSNPTGAVFPRSLLEGIANLAETHNLWLISDEIYERLVYGETHATLASFSPEIRRRTLTLTGCSKTYAMTGWRIGFLVGPDEVAKRIGAFQDQVTSNPTSFAQKGAIAALNLPSAQVEAMRSEFNVRRLLMMEELRQIPGVGVVEPQGAFYFLADFSDHDADDVALANRLLETAHVAAIPGSVFEKPGSLRLSYTASQDDIRRGVRRLGEVLAGSRA